MSRATCRPRTPRACTYTPASHTARARHHEAFATSARWRVAAAVAAVLSAAGASAGTEQCSVAGDTMTCTNEQTGPITLAGWTYVPPITTLLVHGLTSTVSSSTAGVPAITFNTLSGASITLNAGLPGSPLRVATVGKDVVGVYANSRGNAGGSSYIDALQLYVPAGSGGGGGPVVVNNYGSISTSGESAYGMFAQNAIGGYARQVATSLLAYDPTASRDLEVTAVNGVAADVGKAIDGTNGGKFTLAANGTFVFDADGDFSDLDPATEYTTSIDYTIAVDGVQLTTATVTYRYGFAKDAPTQRVETTSVVFDDARLGARPFEKDTGPALLPDLDAWVEALIADGGLNDSTRDPAVGSGTGASLQLANYGSIATRGRLAHGVLVQTESGAGSRGRDGCFFCGEPGEGGPGANGGLVSAKNDGTIVTAGSEATGVLARSVGGAGGKGGEGGPWYYGRAGGAGGNGGDVAITGAGAITTTGAQAVGIYALSAGGAGGNGGSGTASTGGANGATGGRAGNVFVDTTMHVDTTGPSAHGIWGQSVGGSGGTGGASGWWGTGGAGGGGGAMDGGRVDIVSGGEIVVRGDQSMGIWGQSVGGFGGSGGAAIGLFAGWGGDGGSAGKGGDVAVHETSSGTIQTLGDYSNAIYAQSVGGGGGRGGAALGIVALGGGGGTGGHGGEVEVVNDGHLDTIGLRSRGIYAQSIGGGGGDGGDAVGILALGGAGGAASNGGTIDVTNAGRIYTRGIDAAAIYAQSIGGGGGDGGDTVAVVPVGTPRKTLQFGHTNVAATTNTAGGGDGDVVTIANAATGEIATSGDLARGIFAQSIGGGGGAGGSTTALVALGAGKGSAGGAGDLVDIANAGRITTMGMAADAIYAQSIGGGGGVGGWAAGLAAVGGSGGAGGDAGAVDVKNTGTIMTLGSYSRAVFGQSIGGGGGDGAGAGAAISAVGGSGGAAGAGNRVDVDNRGAIRTYGQVSFGVMAQSVGGGGGSGAGAGALIDAIGGAGSTGAKGGDVTVTNSGAIDTFGFAARAIHAQSVGGGGGSGAGSGALIKAVGGSGASAGDGGEVVVTNDTRGTLHTRGAVAAGVYAQSVGGGGGSGAGAGAIAVAIGGDGGASGSGGVVTVTNRGSIDTSGAWSQAVFAQSVGGGGGSVAGDGEGGGAGALGVALGGKGGAAGDGGLVTVTNWGSMATSGFAAQGVYAQSVGGGGGSGGGTGALLAAIGGQGGAAGDGGALVLTNQATGTIETTGFFATGVYAQSIGGGGGSGAGSGALAVALGGDGGASGSGGDITFTNAGRVLTKGDVSSGVYAQSIGGGGGSGGSSGALFVSIGGQGGGAKDADGNEVATGSGGDIAFTNTGDVETRGFFSQGVIAQSVGGGGGHAGSTGAWFASIGGDGGTGGDGGRVIFDNTGAVTTSGRFSTAVFAQSVGGGGGAGGSSGGFFAAIGGDGAKGGHGGYVKVTNAGRITTSGVGARGVHAESIGGGGGTGAGSGALYVAVGGDGGAADYGGDVDVTNDGLVDTSGGLAHAVYASSIGGGGGSASRSGAGMVAIGGTGGSGGAGGSVGVTNTRDLITRGDGSFGVFAQSVGGGGGNGGGVFTITPTPGFSIGVAVGGSGGDGGVGKDVTVVNDGVIDTLGANSHGVFAQSVGGSGGAGGNALAISAAIGGVIDQMPISWSAAVTVGGSGGNGGLADLVTVNQNGGVHTRGFRSYGVLAQSVGGSGGDGGNASSVVLSVNTDVAATVAVGGSGGEAGTGGAVKIDGSGTVLTEGAHAVGVLAQSVGGSGGAGGDSSTVTVGLGMPTGLADLKPSLGFQLDLSLGGGGGGGGDASRVDVLGSNVVQTKGSFASGVLAQSVGGSGGVGGAARSFQFEASLNPTDYLPLLDIFDVGAKIVFGGDGGRGGHGGAVNVDGATSVATAGAFGYGLLAQSVGGGGGAAGTAFDFEFSTTDVADFDNVVFDAIGDLVQYESVLDGGAGAPGNGGPVTVLNDGAIRTSGAAAYGLVAQSVAGGGGIAGLYNPVGVSSASFGPQMRGWLETVPGAGLSFLGSLGGAGTAGAVLVDYAGSIVTTGAGAHAIVAQSAAGTGTASNVTVRLDGSFGALGRDAHGVYAQSVGGAGAGAVTVDVAVDSTVLGGGGSGAAVYVADGAVNTITSLGTIGSALHTAGNAIVATGGNEHATNRGTLIGNVDLGTGTNAVVNHGYFGMGALLSVGAGNLVTNAGIVSPGGAGAILTTTLNGDYVQTAEGGYAVDLDVGRNVVDRIDVTGAATVRGDVGVLLHDTGWMVPGVHGLALMTAAGGLTRDGASIEAAPSAVVKYGLQVVNGTQLQLRYEVDFAPDGLASNGHSFGEYINRVQVAGSSPTVKPLVVAVVAQPTVAQLAYLYERLSPTAYLMDQAQRFWSSLSFDEALHSCRVRDGDLRFSREGECTWIRTNHTESRRDAANGVARVEESRTSVEGGRQKAIGARWHAGVALGYEDGEMDIPGVSSRDGKLYEVGAILKGRYAGNLYTISGSFGYGEHDVMRDVDVPTVGVVARGERDVRLAALHVRYSRDFESRQMYVRPALDAGATTLRAGGFTETGAGAANLRVASETQTYTTVEPTVEIGGEHAFAGGTLLRPYARFGYTKLVSGDDPHVAVSLEGAPEGVAPFTATMAIDDGLTTWSAGVDVLTRGGTAVQLGYTGRRSGDWRSDGAFAKVAVGF